MSTKIFCDIADINQIRKFSKKKIVKGFTTNPSLMRLAGAKDYQKYSKEILKICKKPISFEVFGDDYNSMKRQALIINSWGNNVYVKIPVINSKGIFMGRIIKELNRRNIKLNIILPTAFSLLTIIYVLFLAKPLFMLASKLMSSSGTSGVSQAVGLVTQFGINIPSNETESKWI